MEALFDTSLGAGHTALLLLCVVIALGFEFVNGFHDTANAVATVIYTNALRPTVAVVLSGVCNFIGVFVGGIAVAMGIMKLLPVELLVEQGTGAGLSMVLALLLSAILWNLATWWKGIPSSSSHTLIGAILGVGIGNSLRPGHSFGAGVNWEKAKDVGAALLVSPVLGFALAAGLLLLVRRYTKLQGLLVPPPKDLPPPPGTRALLIGTCTMVSFAHGSNDGQKGVGLMMLILIGLLPAQFALNVHADAATLTRSATAATVIERTVLDHADARARPEADRAAVQLRMVSGLLRNHTATAEVPREERFHVRQAILLADKSVDRLVKSGGLGLTPAESSALSRARAELRAMTDYAPRWVLVAIALALGIGTMVGWRRIVVTVGEKIGSSHLTYAQGACAEIVAASTIGLAAVAGLPVSTTHVLSSGVAGTMVANGSKLQRTTVRNILLAWGLTLPATITLSATLFLLLRLALV